MNEHRDCPPWAAIDTAVADDASIVGDDFTVSVFQVLHRTNCNTEIAGCTVLVDFHIPSHNSLAALEPSHTLEFAQKAGESGKALFPPATSLNICANTLQLMQRTSAIPFEPPCSILPIEGPEV